MISALLEWLEALPPGPVYGVIAVLAALENIIPPVPADTAVALGAFLAAQGTLEWRVVFAVTWGANVGSATAVYAAGWYLGRPFFGTTLGRRLLSERALAAIEREYRRHGLWGIFLSRLLPVWRAVVPPFAGVVRLPAWRVLPSLYLASALWYGTLTYVIYRLGGRLDRALRVLDNVNRGLAVAAVLFAVFVAVMVWRRRRAARTRRDSSDGGAQPSIPNVSGPGEGPGEPPDG